MRPHWWVTKDGDLDCLDMHAKHYSRYEYADERERILFVGPGDKLVLRTGPGDATFVWRKFTDDCIDQRTGQRQQGVNCAVFRNESQHLSSSLVAAADAIADAVWTDRRHYTYVNSEKVASSNPGYCFLMAGWKRCGFTKGGLIVLERITEDRATLPAQTTQDPCYCDRNGLGAPGVSCGDCPTRDYPPEQMSADGGKDTL